MKKNMEYTEITDYAKVCEVNKQSADFFPNVSNLPKEEADDVIKSLMLKRVIRALNTDPETGKVWEPDWSDHSQLKYSVWVEVEASKDQPWGFGFSLSYYVNWGTDAIAGSRLCLESRDKVMHLHKYFKQLLLDTYLILR